MTININKNGSEATVILTGSLDTVAANQVADQIKNLTDGEITDVTIDCSGMNYIASSGLRILLMLRKQCKAKGGNVTLIGVQANVMEVLIITHFDKLFILK